MCASGFVAVYLCPLPLQLVGDPSSALCAMIQVLSNLAAASKSVGEVTGDK